MLSRILLVATASFAMAGTAAEADTRTVKVGNKEKEKAPTAIERKAQSFFLFSDNQMSYRHHFTAAEPGHPKRKTADPSDGRDIPKNYLNISHADAWRYGTNFLNLDVIHSGSQDPAGTRNTFGGQTVLFGNGATEIYALYRGSLSGNKIAGSNVFVIPGLVKDVSLSFGGDINTKETPFGPNKKLLVGGLVFSFDVPIGFLNVAVHASHEWNRNGFFVAPYREVEFKTTPEFEVTYTVPLDSVLFGLPLRLAGFNTIVLPKGHVGSPNSVPTNLEFLSRTNLVLDLGKLIWDQPGKLDVFAGFQYWRNKFGNDKDFYNRVTTPAQYLTSSSGAGSEEKTALVGVSVHFN